jgi:hypothetical protein
MPPVVVEFIVLIALQLWLIFFIMELNNKDE